MNNQASSQRQSLRGAIVSSSKLQIAAVFDSKQRAEKMLDIVSDETRVDKSHMQIIDKHDPRFSEKLEKSSSKIGKSLWSSHLVLGGIGLGIGMVVAFLLTQFGPALTQQNAMFTYIALISPGIFIGLFVAGLFGLRPDRDHLVQNVKNAVRYGKVALVINIPKSQSSTEIVTLLDQQASRVIESVK
jgi:hypothetical protein